MDNETKEFFNTNIGELGRVEQRIYEKLDKVNNKLETVQKDINLLIARNDG